MSLFEIKPEPVPHPGRKRAALILIVVIVIAALAWWRFRFYPEERIVKRFMNTVVAGDLPSAYQQWKAGPDYSFDDFKQDWGQGSPWGIIRSYKITHVEGKTGVVSFTIVINGVGSKPIDLWVQRKSKALSFAPPK